MRVLMLGWELPPSSAGGLATACQGLLAGLRERRVDVTYVAPRVHASASGPARAVQQLAIPQVAIEVPTSLEPYPRSDPSGDEYTQGLEAFRRRRERAKEGVSTERVEARLQRLYRLFPPRDRPRHAGLSAYDASGVDPGDGARRYAERVVERVGDLEFDVVHAHDWMTYPAALRLRDRTGRPVVCHVHSTELDRAGSPGHAAVLAIEGEGLRAADRVVCVSRATAADVRERYGVLPERLRVVHNAVLLPRRRSARHRVARAHAPTMLFLGRVTRQKAPLAFLEVAARVAALVPAARFVLAGDGDLLPAAREHARRLGLEGRVELPGLLGPAARDAALARADLLLVPSVSEPFGIVALEAAAAGTLPLVPARSGAAEVLASAPRIDPADLDGTATAAAALLLDPERRLALSAATRREAVEADWSRRADSLLAIYGELVG